MDKTYDLNLPDWGPYSKRFLGLSHVADKKSGARFDIDLFFGRYRQTVLIPDVLQDTGVKPWEAAPDFSSYTYRYELEWKDRVYCDVDFLKVDDDTRLIACRFVNRTTLPQALSLNLFASIDYPKLYRTHKDAICPATVQNPGGALVLDAVEYAEIVCGAPLPQDGLYRGEYRASGLVGGAGISEKAFCKKGDALTYRFAKTEADAVGIRLKCEQGGRFLVRLFNVEQELTVLPNENFTYCTVCLPRGHYSELEFCALDGCPAAVDAFVVGMHQAVESVLFETPMPDYTPEIVQEERSLKLSYPGILHDYYIYWPECGWEVRQFLGDGIEKMAVNAVHNHVSKTFRSEGHEHHTNLFIRPIFIAPKSEWELPLLVSTKKLAKPVFERPETKKFQIPCNPSGQEYLFSQQKMAATTLLNVVYPIYCRRGYIKHHTPGKIWDSLYTWDSGFIGLGLAVLDTARAEACLNTYLTPKGDMHSPFIFHGTVLPTQILLYAALFCRTQDTAFLARYYAFIRQCYRFLADLRKSAKQPRSGLVSTWHLFYNSGGWDDYPPQKYVQENGLRNTVSPVITSAYIVLCAKLLKPLAKRLKEDADLLEYDADIAFYSHALQAYAWDAESGYYGYVVHDASGAPTGILRDAAGVNYNMGMDGVYPLIAGICSPGQKEKLLSHIKNDLFSKTGLSTVDPNAPYYRKDGYWNGAVWMPHQWILWRALLDLGEAAFAGKIAKTALTLWKNETEETYNCCEHFLVENGRGAGFHQFSGLSTPVLLWFEAYFVPGTVTAGFFTTITSQTWNPEKTAVTFEVDCAGGDILICMKEGPQYCAVIDGKPAALSQNAGTLEITLAAGTHCVEILKSIE